MVKKKKPSVADEEDKKFPLPVYDASEDIYRNEKEESLPDEEKATAGRALDVPGSELDDADEEIGDEDEENNYYSLGGDDHQDLEEDQGDKD
jgi:hypothetical protein